MLKIYFDEVLINEDGYAEVTNEYKLFNDSFYLGSVASNTFKLKVLKSEVSSHPSDVTIEDENTTFHLIADKVEEDKGFYNYSLTDKMVNFNFNYDAKVLIDEKAALEEATYLSDILEDMCLKAGVELDYTLTNDIIVSWYDNRIQAREYLSFIAELEGGYACINELGKLTIKQHKQASKKSITTDEVSELIVGEKKTITRVVYDNGVVPYEFGDDTGNTLYLNQNNVFITDELVVENIYNKIVNFEFYTTTVPNSLIDSSIKAGDVITFVDGDKEYQTIAQYSSSYGGGWTGSYDFNINTERQQETKVVGISESVKRIESEFDREKNRITLLAEELGEYDEATNKFIIDSEKISQMVGLSYDFIREIDGYGNLTLEDFHPDGIISLKLTGTLDIVLPHSGLYPSPNLYPKSISLVVTNGDETNTYRLPYFWLHEVNGVKDELILTKDNLTWIKRTNYFGDATIEEETIEFPLIKIQLLEGNNTIYILGEDNIRFDCVYAIKNELTDKFITEAEVNTKIEISAGEIEQSVSEKLDGEEIVSRVNQTASTYKVDAKNINLNGVVTANENFKIHLDGSMEANKGTFKGDIYLPDGGRVIGGDGLLSTIVIQGSVKSQEFLGTTIFSPMGYSPTDWHPNGSISSVRDNLAFEFTIPKGFAVVRAYIVLEHMPAVYSVSGNTGYSRNLRLYKASGIANAKYTFNNEFWQVGFSGLIFSEVSDALGTPGFTGNSNGYSKIISNDIKESITTSTTDEATNILKIETANGLVTTQNALEQQSGACRATLNIIGYMPFDI